MTLSQLDGSLMLSRINLAGTHDSCTAFVSMESMSRCQSLTVKEQLALGIRLFDIRLSRRGNEFYLVHALADCFSDKEKTVRLTFDEVLCELESFLAENPGEALVVSIKQDRGIKTARFFSAFYKKYICGREDRWYLKNEGPCLSDCRGKMVLMRRCRVSKEFAEQYDAGLDFSHWPDQDGKRKTNTELITLSEKERLIAEVQDRYCLDVDVKWEKCAKAFLDREEKSEAEIKVHFISTSCRKRGGSLLDTAEQMNSRFMAYSLREDRAQGWFLFDFPDAKLISKVMNSNKVIYEVGKI